MSDFQRLADVNVSDSWKKNAGAVVATVMITTAVVIMRGTTAIAAVTTSVAGATIAVVVMSGVAPVAMTASALGVTSTIAVMVMSAVTVISCLSLGSGKSKDECKSKRGDEFHTILA